MKLERLSDCNKHYFSVAFSLFESAFPWAERRELAEQQRILSIPEYHYDLILKNQSLLGLMLYWELDHLIFLEHFTTMPHMRNQGVGSAALSLLKERGKPIMLEIEPPQDQLTCRRYGFYQRNGFQMNPFYHIQAKYHPGDDDLELKILSYPRLLTEEEYQGFYSYMIRYISCQS